MAEDNWVLSSWVYTTPNSNDLTDAIKGAPVFRIKDIKTFIQKIKEYVTKLGVEYSIEKDFNDDLFKIIDKLAGDLK
tara:strand:+ start:1150 stop:1380 length:231 start_codon:yes stop_codon:yes gene_type:complete